MSETKKTRLLAAADLAVFPSRGGEAFGIVLLEAIAAGTPVLAGDNPGYHSVLGDIEGSLFDVKNPNQLPDRLSSLLSSPSERRWLYERQRGLIDKYSLERVGPKLMNLYRQTIKSRGKLEHKRDTRHTKSQNRRA